jgi:hypothetical protein
MFLFHLGVQHVKLVAPKFMGPPDGYGFGYAASGVHRGYGNYGNAYFHNI